MQVGVGGPGKGALGPAGLNGQRRRAGGRAGGGDEAPGDDDDDDAPGAPGAPGDDDDAPGGAPGGALLPSGSDCWCVASLLLHHLDHQL